MSDWPIFAMIGSFILLIAILLGLIFVSYENFADRCERAGGVNIQYKVCVPAGTDILMVS